MACRTEVLASRLQSFSLVPTPAQPGAPSAFSQCFCLSSPPAARYWLDTRLHRLLPASHSQERASQGPSRGPQSRGAVDKPGPASRGSESGSAWALRATGLVDLCPSAAEDSEAQMAPSPDPLAVRSRHLATSMPEADWTEPHRLELESQQALTCCVTLDKLL